jgi:hypothetical protein
VKKTCPGRRTGSRLIRRRSAIATLCPDYSNLGDLRQEKSPLSEGRKTVGSVDLYPMRKIAELFFSNTGKRLEWKNEVLVLSVEF